MGKVLSEELGGKGKMFKMPRLGKHLKEKIKKAKEDGKIVAELVKDTEEQNPDVDTEGSNDDDGVDLDEAAVQSEADSIEMPHFEQQLKEMIKEAKEHGKTKAEPVQELQELRKAFKKAKKNDGKVRREDGGFDDLSDINEELQQMDEDSEDEEAKPEPKDNVLDTDSEDEPRDKKKDTKSGKGGKGSGKSGK